MKINDVTIRDIIKIALDALPHCEDDVDVVITTVNVRDGSVEVLPKKTRNFDWTAFTNKKAIFHLWRDNISDVDTLVQRHRHEICGNILEIKEEHPHLFE